ncbi:BatD family protein [Mesonia aquimarina]|uniref:BatD family protein n=1 Tax=Mesonia aquimarina TaxID=1504967 RepID=UPI000EF5927E|nr:BatD family protein [Mesonia aquimarina]
MEKNGNIIYGFLIVFLFVLGTSKLNSQTVWANVDLNKSSVYVGEPLQVSITVYTSTWFTKGIDLDNLKVNGAFSVYFRPVSRSFVSKGQNYAGVELIYNVFPFSEDDVIFPALEIEVETPAPGDYKGAKRIVKTKEKTIKVKPVPPNFENDQWLVASSLSVRENWSGNKNKVKVGDVLTRTITRKAAGTVPELIPPTVWDSFPHVSLYEGKQFIDNFKSKTSISAQRTETVRYLFEKEGEITIPEKIYTWYNPYQKKLFKRTLKSFTINVARNPDLGMLTSVRDSLKLEEAKIAESVEKKTKTKILGLSVKQFTLVLLLSVLILLALIYSFKKIVRQVIKAREAYRNSEKYYFNKFLKTLKQKNKEKTVNTFYRWLDELNLNEPTLTYLVKNFYSKEEKIEDEYEFLLHKNRLKKIRKNYLKNQFGKPTDRVNWINP